MGWHNRIGLVVFALAIGIAPLVIGEIYLLVPIGITVLVTTGLSLLLGYAGQISLGHAAFYAIGAYTSGLLTVHWEWSPWLAMAAGALLSAVVAYAIGTPSLRLHGHYLAMATLAFGEIVRVILDAWYEVTGGPSGFGGIPALSLFGYELDPILEERSCFYFVWGVALIGLWGALNLVHSRVGRALRSIHAGERAANLLGVPTAAYKVRIFVVSAVYASIAGSLYAHIFQYLNPPPFGLLTSIIFVLMVIIGGTRTLWGAMVGTILMGMLPEWLSGMEDWWIVIYGAVLMVTMIFIPQGLLLGARDAALRLWRRIRPAQAEEAA